MQKLAVTNSSTGSQSTSLTYEEENAIRYVGGYVIKSMRAKLKSPQDDELTLGLDELCITDDVEPAESEEWLCSIDRGQWRIQDFLKGGSNSAVAREARAKFLKPRPLWGKTTPISIVFERNYQSY